MDPVVLTALDKVRWRASVNPATSTPCPGVMDGQHHECLVASHAKDHGAEQPWCTSTPAPSGRPSRTPAATPPLCPSSPTPTTAACCYGCGVSASTEWGDYSTSRQHIELCADCGPPVGEGQRLRRGIPQPPVRRPARRARGDDVHPRSCVVARAHTLARTVDVVLSTGRRSLPSHGGVLAGPVVAAVATHEDAVRLLEAPAHFASCAHARGRSCRRTLSRRGLGAVSVNGVRLAPDRALRARQLRRLSVAVRRSVAIYTARRPWRSSVACVFDADCGASSCPTDDHHFVAFGVGDLPAILRLVKEPATATVVARRVCARSDGTASSKWMRLRCRRRSVSKASSSWNTTTGFSRRGSWMSMTSSPVVGVSEAATQNARTAATSAVSRRS